MDGIIRMENVLFIIPHPDDEIVGSCIIIRELLLKKKKYIYIFYFKWCYFKRVNVVLGKK
jgi:hypothetical protein